jgi:hypothetical protein
MKSQRHTRKPVIEQFESKNLMSAGVTGLHGPAAVSAQPIQLIVPLNGTFDGQFTKTEKNPDIGATYSFSGTGKVQRIGEFSVDGTIHTIGFIQFGPVQGTFVLRNAAGSITVQFTATGKGFGLPVHYKYKITHGTGMYTNAVDHGTAALTTTYSTSTGATFGVQHGQFKLVMKSAFPEPMA